MNDLLFRTRAALLWVSVSIASAGSMLVYVFLPGALEELLAGEFEGEALTDAIAFFVAALVIVPLVMAGVTLLVGEWVNRRVNLISGLVLGLLGVFAVVGHVVDDGFNAHILSMAVASALALLIATLSWRELRRPTSQAAAPPSERGRHPELTTSQP